MNFEAGSSRAGALAGGSYLSVAGGVAALAALTVCLGVLPGVSAAQSPKPATEQGVPLRKLTPLQAGQETFPSAAAAVQALATAVQSNRSGGFAQGAGTECEGHSLLRRSDRRSK